MTERIRIILKSGHVEEMTFDEFNIMRGAVSGSLQEVQWKQSDLKSARLHYLRIDEVACIISLPIYDGPTPEASRPIGAA
jgi:hypothetical protein